MYLHLQVKCQITHYGISYSDTCLSILQPIGLMILGKLFNGSESVFVVFLVCKMGILKIISVNAGQGLY